MAPPAFNLTALDHQLLAMTDEEFVAHDWNDLQSIIGECAKMGLNTPSSPHFPKKVPPHSPD
jgi:hypothetical protein